MARPRIDRVVTLGTKITELRRQLAVYETELASLLRARAKDGGGRKTATHARRGGARGTTARIVRLLTANPHAVLHASDLAKLLGANVASIRVMLKRLVEAKKIRRTGRGAYRAR